MFKPFKKFLLETLKDDIQVTVTGQIDDQKLKKLIDSVNAIGQIPASILTQTSDKVVISFNSKTRADVFIKLCKAEHIRCYISKTSQWTAYEVIKNILDGFAWYQNFEGTENFEKGVYQISRPWVAISEKGMFSDMDSPPGFGGVIGLPDIHGTSPEALAAAAHEAYHAYAHQHNLASVRTDEKWTNDMAEKWLKDHLTGSVLKQAIDYIDMSRKSHKI